METERSHRQQFADIITPNDGIQNENQSLRAENRRLGEENSRLRAQVSELEKTTADRIAESVAKAVDQATAPLVEELQKAHTEISRLKAIINKDSTNSSKPSSADRLKGVRNSREKSDKQQGAQKGHTGSRLKLPENMEELEKKGIIERRLQDHTDGSSEYVSRYTIDLEIKVIITEHRFGVGDPLPEDMYNEVSYGDGIKAQTVLLTNEGIVAHKRLCKIISSLTHGIVNLSTGTMNKFQRDFADRLTETGELESIKQDLMAGEIMNTDDTTMRVLERMFLFSVSARPFLSS